MPVWILAMHSIAFNYFFQVFIPMHINNNHWALLVLNFIKTEVQILNSIPEMRDMDQEKALVSTDPLRNTYHLLSIELQLQLYMYLTIHQVEVIQSSIQYSVNKELVKFVKPINLHDWKIVPYDNRLQQTDKYSFSFLYQCFTTITYVYVPLQNFMWGVCNKIYTSMGRRSYGS